MSLLNTYDLPDLIGVDKDKVNCDIIHPGSFVKHKSDELSLGTVIARAWGPSDKPMQVTVLWTREPRLIENFALPNVRRVFPSLIANQIVNVQPMTLPAGLVFYMNYTYGSGSKDKV